MKPKKEKSHKSLLTKLISNKSAHIGIVGLGYVGLPLALNFAEKGFKTIGLDIDANKIKILDKNDTYINHISKERIRKAKVGGYLEVTSVYSEISKTNVVIICVPTPLNKYREPDLTFIRSTLKSVLPFLKKGMIISLESTTYPGTTEEELKPALEEAGFNIGEDFFLVYSPEREDPGNKLFTTSKIPKVLGGCTHNCKDIGVKIYEQVFEKVIEVSSTSTAEMTKLLENIHRAVNIGLMNELKPLADKMGIDMYEVIRAAATKPFGFVPYYPGPGLGGHCIPIDPFYLTWKAREFGMHTRFIELAGEINSRMPQYVVEKTFEALNNLGKPLKGSKVLILGISYKKNIDDTRESPSVELIKLFTEREADVKYSDNYFPDFPKMRNYNFKMKSIDITQELLNDSDVVVLATDHDYFDFEFIQKNSNLIIDTRGKFTPSKKIIRA